MLGIFGTLNLATRSLSTQRVGTEIAGHNLANVNNSAYARQRVNIETALPIPTELGPQGTGADAVSIRQIRDQLLDRQIQNETSVRGWLEAQQQALQYAQANLGQEIDRQASGAEGAAATGGVGGQNGLAEGLAGFFNAFQSLSTNPTNLAERQVLLIKAQNLAVQFNQIDQRLANVHSSLNNAIQIDVDNANRLISDVAKLNEQIVAAEIGIGGTANDLRDIRQQRLEELAKLVNFSTTAQPSGSVDIVINGTPITSGALVNDQLEAYDPGSGSLLLRLQNSGTPVNLTSGSLQGTIEARDGGLATLRQELNQLAAHLVSTVNTLHTPGYDLTGNTGQAFFTGTNAATLAVNTTLTTDPGRIQAADAPNAPGNNRIALALAQLAQQNQAALGNQTFNQRYGQTVAAVGQSLSSVNAQLNNQQIVESMLLRQRDAVGGVSIDEEMTDLIKYQRAFEASARLVTTLDEMLTILVNLGR
jgi:flagellar hook-associated protein 1 FlgK